MVRCCQILQLGVVFGGEMVPLSASSHCLSRPPLQWEPFKNNFSLNYNTEDECHHCGCQQCFRQCRLWGLWTVKPWEGEETILEQTLWYDVTHGWVIQSTLCISKTQGSEELECCKRTPATEIGRHGRGTKPGWGKQGTERDERGRRIY